MSLHEAPPEPTRLQPSPAAPTVTRPPREGSATLAHESAGPPVAGRAGLPRYDLARELGRGGMGVVYEARDRELNRTVALKMVLYGVRAGSAAVQRFLAEAEALAAVQHPHVVQVFDRGEYDGLPFFAMEFCPGGSLATRVKDNPLSAREAATVVERLARGVQAAHDQGILHRDLKPENVLFDAAGSPKLTDFGLAKRLADSLVGSALTATGAVMGTPSYMAPEQAAGRTREIGPGTDVYGLGAVLYRLVAGRPPFLGADTAETIRQVVEAEPLSPTQLVPALPRDLATVCLKCLQKDPRKRYASAAELAADLGRYLHGHPIVARPVGRPERAWRWVRRNPAVASLMAAVAVVLLAGAAVATAFALDARRQQRWALDEKGRADDETALARQEKKRADDGADEARRQRNEARRLNGLSATAEGARAADAGDAHAAVVWFAESMARDPDDAALDRAARRRAANYTRYAAPLRLAALLPHPGRVWQAAFAPDGRVVVTATREGQARVWDAATGEPVTGPFGHAGGILAVAFAPDGRRVATAGADGTARVWDARTGRPATPPLPHQARGPNRVTDVAFAPDGRRLVTAGTDATARVWDADTGRPLAELPHDQDLTAAAFTPDGRRVVTAGSGGAVCVWDADDAAGPKVRFDAGAFVAHLAVAPDGRRLATAHHDHTARVWDLATGRPRTPPLAHRDRVSCVAFDPDGDRLVTASDDFTARVWDARTGEPVTPPLRHAAEVAWAAFAPAGRSVATAGFDGMARVWDARTGQPATPWLRHGDKVRHVAFSPDGGRLVSSGFDGAARVWDLRGSALPAGGPAAVHDPADLAAKDASADGARRVGYDRDGRTLRVWDARSGRPVTPGLDTGGGLVRRTAFSPDGRRVALALTTRHARVWDADAGRPITPPLAHEGVVNDVCFAPDGTRVATAGDDGTARVWDAGTGTAVTPPLRHAAGVRQVCFAPDGRRVATASWDHTARVWDARTGEPIGPPLRHLQDVDVVRFSPAGDRVATGSQDGAARVWDAETGRALTPEIHTGAGVDRLAFSPDGLWLATGSGSGVARVWVARTGQPVTPPLAHGPGEVRVGWSADGSALGTVGPDGRPRWWDLTGTDRPLADLRDRAELLACLTVDPTGTAVPLTSVEDQAARLRRLRARHPDDVRVPFADADRWRRAQIAACLGEGNLTGATFHYHWLIAEAAREPAQALSPGR